jgi:hypothetical protein
MGSTPGWIEDAGARQMAPQPFRMGWVNDRPAKRMLEQLK